MPCDRSDPPAGDPELPQRRAEAIERLRNQRPALRTPFRPGRRPANLAKRHYQRRGPIHVVQLTLPLGGASS